MTERETFLFLFVIPAKAGTQVPLTYKLEIGEYGLPGIVSAINPGSWLSKAGQDDGEKQECADRESGSV